MRAEESGIGGADPAALILKLADAFDDSVAMDGAVRSLARDEMEALAGFGARADRGDWADALAEAAARRLSDLAAAGEDEAGVGQAALRLLGRFAGLAARLPGGAGLDRAALLLDVYNRSRVLLRRRGLGDGATERALRQACTRLAA